jgi:exonuclease SbcC
MITLQSIRIRNFRAVAEATFKPLEQGITGIFGPNGAGKTTFLSATMFALYGVRPPDASLASLRREGSEGECSVSVLFKHLSQTIEVVRELKGKTNRIIVNIYVDGVPQTVASVGAADQWITQRLGVDANGFMTAFVVRQKELDQLITARPAERKQIIERLAGIDTIKHALQAAREDENQAKKVLANIPGTESAVEEAENQLNLLSQKAENLKTDREKLYKDQQALVSQQKTMQVKYNSMRDEELENVKNASALENLAKELASLQEQKARLSYLKDVKEGDDIDSLRKDHQTLTANIVAQTTRLNELRVQQRGNQATVDRESEKISQNQGKIQSLIKPVEDRETLESQFNLAEETRVACLARKNIVVSKSADLQSSIALLAHSTECPTCHTDLAEPEKLILSFKESIKEYEEELEELTSKLDEAETIITTSSDALRILNTISTLLEEVSNSENAIAVAQSTDHETEISKIEADITALESDRERVTELGLKARNLKVDRETLKEIDLKINFNLEKTEDLETALANTKISFSPDALEKLNIELAKVQTKIDASVPELETITSEKNQTDSRLSMAESTYKTARDQWNRKKDLMDQQQKLVLTTDLLDKFRSDSISSLAPELSEFATSLISDMTNGDFTEIRLDDEFNASIVDSSGAERPSAWLSGGEVSAVALAMRIAIGFLITGGNPQLLWLDEVMTAQDADRRMAMLSMIRALPIDQIIMINHTQEAADIVDHTITLVKDLEKGSYISED